VPPFSNKVGKAGKTCLIANQAPKEDVIMFEDGETALKVVGRRREDHDKKH